MNPDLLGKLNNDIWHPFRLVYARLDASALLSLYSPELIRAGGPAKQVQGFAELSGGDSSVSVSCRFVERLVMDGVARERGIFQLVSTCADGRLVHGVTRV
ncbi:hypothetical protein [Lentzea sp. NPDC003310]|uniref:hypothetical protein n=1 Tax=Lentzea sp. NPDC003310 TaxID=3154447 RepID=UPI0033A42C02